MDSHARLQCIQVIVQRAEKTSLIDLELSALIELIVHGSDDEIAAQARLFKRWGLDIIVLGRH